MDVDRETEINLSRREVRALLLHEFLLSYKATSNLRKTMGQNIIFTRTVQRWFNRFNNRNYELDDFVSFWKIDRSGFGSIKTIH